MTSEEITLRFASIDMTMAKLDEKLDVLRTLLTRNEKTAARDLFPDDQFAAAIAESIIGARA